MVRDLGLEPRTQGLRIISDKVFTITYDLCCISRVAFSAGFSDFGPGLPRPLPAQLS